MSREIGRTVTQENIWETYMANLLVSRTALHEAQDRVNEAETACKLSLNNFDLAQDEFVASSKSSVKSITESKIVCGRSDTILECARSASSELEEAGLETLRALEASNGLHRTSIEAALDVTNTLYQYDSACLIAGVASVALEDNISKIDVAQAENSETSAAFSIAETKLAAAYAQFVSDVAKLESAKTALIEAFNKMQLLTEQAQTLIAEDDAREEAEKVSDHQPAHEDEDSSSNTVATLTGQSETGEAGTEG